MMGYAPKLRRMLASLLLAFSVSACTNLEGVRQWAATSLQASQFNEIVGTYADTPRRIAFYDSKAADFWAQQGEIREAQSEALTLQLSVVSDYMAALTALSSDSASDYSKDVGALVDSLKKTGRMSETTIGAVGNLVATLLNASLKAWQKGQIALLIEQANDPLQKILKNELKSIVAGDFQRDLKIEAEFLDVHFKGLLRQGSGSAAANAALNEWFVLRKSENARRVVAVKAYLDVLDKIAVGHQKLFDGRGDLDEKKLVKDLFKLAKEMRGNIKDLLKS